MSLWGYRSLHWFIIGNAAKFAQGKKGIWGGWDLLWLAPRGM